MKRQRETKFLVYAILLFATGTLVLLFSSRPWNLRGIAEIAFGGYCLREWHKS